MAEMVAEHLTMEDDNTFFLWAHNGHIRKSKSFFYKPLGYHLSGRLKENYLTISLDFYEGEIKNTYRDGYTFYEPLQDKAWVGNITYDATMEIQLIKMSTMPKVKIRNIGIGNGTLKTKRNKDFDYLFFFNTVHP